MSTSGSKVTIIPATAGWSVLQAEIDRDGYPKRIFDTLILAWQVESYSDDAGNWHSGVTPLGFGEINTRELEYAVMQPDGVITMAYDETTVYSRDEALARFRAEYARKKSRHKIPA